jgi:ribosomal subunit interface protein
MDIPLQITFHGLEHSDAIEERIRAKAKELERFAPHIVSCHVTVELASSRHHQGKIFSVHVRLRVPDGELVASRESGRNHAHEDVYVSLRDAFNAATRQLEDYVRRQRRDVKQHDSPVLGTITKLFRDDGYGFLQLDDGTDVYFHENSVVGSPFAQLHMGDEVRLVVAEGEGEKGPQASTVTATGKHLRPA